MWQKLAWWRRVRSLRGDKGLDDRKFLEAPHYFTWLTWRALAAEFGPWNSVWKRFWRPREPDVFEAFSETLARPSGTAHLIQMSDSTVVRAHTDRRWCQSAVRISADLDAGPSGCGYRDQERL